MTEPTRPVTLDKLAEQYGTAIGDVIPTDTKFVLLVFRPGTQAEVLKNEAGIAYVTCAEAQEAITVVRAFLSMVDASTAAAPG